MVSKAHGGRHEAGRKAAEGGRGRPDKASSAAVERYLRGVGFPATKDELIEQARENNAPGDVISVLDKLDEKEYRDAVDITKEFGRIE